MFPEAGRAKTNGARLGKIPYALAHIGVIDLAMLRINRQAVRDGPNAFHDRLQIRAIGAASQNATLRQTVLCVRDAHIEEKELQLFHHFDAYCTSSDLRTMAFVNEEMRRRGDYFSKDIRDHADLTDRLRNPEKWQFISQFDVVAFTAYPAQPFPCTEMTDARSRSWLGRPSRNLMEVYSHI